MGVAPAVLQATTQGSEAGDSPSCQLGCTDATMAEVTAGISLCPLLSRGVEQSEAAHGQRVAEQGPVSAIYGTLIYYFTPGQQKK